MDEIITQEEAFDLNFKFSNRETKYEYGNWYYILYDTINSNRIMGIFGFLARLESFSYLSNENIKTIEIGQINEDTFNLINKSCTSTYLMTFYDEIKHEFFYRKLEIEAINDTEYDKNEKVYFSPSNIIEVKISFKDDNDNELDDIKDFSFKNMRLLNEFNTLNQVKINNIEDIRKLDNLPNPSIMKIELLDKGSYNFRVKAVIPQVNDIWLTKYFSAKTI